MSDSSEPNMAFEADDNVPDIDFQVLDEGEGVPAEAAPDPLAGKKVLTQEEYDALMARQDSTAALNQGLGALAETLRTPAPAAPANMPAPPVITDEDFEKAVFTPGKTKQILQELIQQNLGQVQGQNLQQQIMLNKRLLKLDPKTSEYFTRYEGEIEKRVAALPPQVRYRPDIYEAVYKEVLIDKQEDIIQERAQAIATKAVQEALEKAGIGTPDKKPVALRMEAGGVGAPAKPKKTVYLTQSDIRDMAERGLNPKDPDQVKAYYNRYKKGKE